MLITLVLRMYTIAWGEEMANFSTPNDGASYVRGQLVDDATGQPIRAGGMTSTGNRIRGTFDNQKNNIEGFGGLGAGAILNSGRETLGKPTCSW